MKQLNNSRVSYTSFCIYWIIYITNNNREKKERRKKKQENYIALFSVKKIGIILFVLVVY